MFSWQNKAGGGGQCNSMAVAAAETLLAAAGNCDQQNSADQFVTFAKTLSNPSQMISLAQIFVQQPRNTVSPCPLSSAYLKQIYSFIQPDSLAVPYCDQAPVNSELDGLFQCQYQGADLSQFVGGLSVGQKGTIPFGHDGPVTPPGSCFAHTGGPISSGSQLVDIITSPNAPNGASPGSGGSAVATAGSAGTTNSDPNPTNSTTSVALTVPPASSATSAFQTANGQAAQGLNAHFATLTDDSPCTGMYLCSSTNKIRHFISFST